jgi:hypothetical protein
MKVLILAFDRPECLTQTCEALNEFFTVDKIYFYVDKFYDKKTKEKQAEVLSVIEKCKIPYELKVSSKNEGTQIAMKKALEFAFENETEVMVLEEDIKVTKESYDFFTTTDRTSDVFLIKFGMFYWGYYLNKKAFELLVSVNFANMTEKEYEQNKEHFRDKTEFLLIRELYRKSANYPFDDEFDLTSKIAGIKIQVPQMPTTVHLGAISSRIERDKKNGKQEHVVIKMRKGIFV